jgi:hypothetical protein
MDCSSARAGASLPLVCSALIRFGEYIATTFEAENWTGPYNQLTMPLRRRREHVERPPAGTLLVSTACVLVALATCAVAFLAPWLPGPLSDVQIRWADGVSEDDKLAAASRLQLRLLDVRDDGVWTVETLNPERATIRALVTDPQVADTHNIDRAEYRVIRAPRQTVLDRASGMYPRFAAFKDSYLDRGLAGDRMPLLILLVGVAVGVTTSVRTGRAPWLERGIPIISPRALALFRVLFGLAMLWAVLRTGVAPLPAELQRDTTWLARVSLIRQISESAAAITLVKSSLAGALAAFSIGLLPRTSLALAATLLTILAGVMTTRTSIHDC